MSSANSHCDCLFSKRKIYMPIQYSFFIHNGVEYNNYIRNKCIMCNQRYITTKERLIEEGLL
jgi:hypothetical protein